MKIIICVGSIAMGGAERAALALATHLSLQEVEVEIALLSSSAIPRHFSVPKGVFLAELGVHHSTTGVNAILSSWRLSRFIRRSNPDTVISFVTHSNIKMLLATIGNTNINKIVCERRNPKSQRYNLIIEWLANWLYRQASAITTQTEAARSYVAMNTVCSDVRAIPNFIEDDIFIDATNQNEERYKRQKIMVVGRLVACKQVDHALDVFEMIHEQLPDAELHVLGDGPMREPLNALCQLHPSRHKITFHGSVTAVQEAVSDASLLLHCSKFEGFPNCILEACALGVPVVAYDCESGPSEILTVAREYCLAPLNAKGEMAELALNLLNDYELWSQISAALQVSVKQRFSWSTVSRQWLALCSLDRSF